ncbi:DUF397 domain-containing protein [Streptomyces sp. NBC_01210]|uniref:DUF397 domain-containing protein n=1 Tax=Streptomyces sp. NBC_01210 TaxID=2903774 RepID=UPI002E0EECAA|nr:DUF397 domain-containing protein [Streptomyces sp. NBC_01210]
MSTDLKWFKSSYSSEQGECVEVAVDWFKSSYSGDQGECVEVATCPAAIHVRDSKDTTRPALTLSPTAWTALIETVRRTPPTR